HEPAALAATGARERGTRRMGRVDRLLPARAAAHALHARSPPRARAGLLRVRRIAPRRARAERCRRSGEPRQRAQPLQGEIVDPARGTLKRMQLSVLTWNIHKGFNSANSAFVLPRMRELIREAQVDMVLLQEVLGEHRAHARHIANWPQESQFE